ncbi:MEDS domain-containing protein [Streptomyces sp. NPDC088354]|uniref:MEDS domain-containing protein n=1 Tax=unclassified Streptomyces TaxID=2593676 RepID=UPI0029A4FAF6|nr:MEDS domain-containing protein [Streptomyces sp. MI02-7b]MDX3076743.1 MEDS domain-containing protein [Streptomyces sp. MI02-7b]
MDSGTVPRTVPVDRMASGDHACLGFEDEEARWEVRAAFTAIGLGQGERVLLFSGRGTPPAEAVTRLTALGVRASEAVRRGALVITPLVPGYDSASAWTALTDTARRLGYRGLRAAGDMSWALRPGLDRDRLVGHEAAMTQVLAGLGLTAVCEYDQRRFHASLLARVRAAHPMCLRPPSGALHVERLGGTLALSGDADLATRTDFEVGLRHAFGSPAGPPCVIDLTGLGFIDARCAGVLIRHAASLGPADRVTVRCPRLHARTLRLCGATEVPQLVLDETA